MKESPSLTVRKIECVNYKLDSGHDGHRLGCTLGVWLSDGRYQEIDVESFSNPRDWER